jgi:chromate transport protein ChrA
MLFMIGFAYGINSLGPDLPLFVIAILNGLTSSAVGLVALAAYKLGTKILADPLSVCIGTFCAVMAVNFKFAWLFPVLMIAGGTATMIEHYIHKKGFQNGPMSSENDTEVEIANDEQEELLNPDGVSFWRNTKLGVGVLVLWAMLLVLSIFLRVFPVPTPARLWGTMYFVGSIIFGGGPVVIPLLQSFVVEESWMTDREFLLGLALINAMPGPNFNIAAFCGALALRASTSLMFFGGLIANFGIFLPGLLLMTALIPLWRAHRKNQMVQAVFKGVNAGAVGLVFTAIYLLSKKSIVGVSTSLIDYPFYTSLAAITYSVVGFMGMPAPLAIITGGLLGYLHSLL